MIYILNVLSERQKEPVYLTFATLLDGLSEYERVKLEGAVLLLRAHTPPYNQNASFRRQDKSPTLFIDILPQYRKYARPNSLAARLRAGVCETCSAETRDIHMHHIKCLKDLAGRNEFELLMMAKRRKSLALCSECYEKAKHLHK